MIKLIFDRLKSFCNIPKIDNPTEGFIHITLDMDLNPIRMAVDASTLMTLWNERQTMSGLEGELTEDLHMLRVPSTAQYASRDGSGPCKVVYRFMIVYSGRSGRRGIMA